METFIILFLILMAIVLAYNFMENRVRAKSDIIQIKDIEMKVTWKKRDIDRDEFRHNYYYVYYEGLYEPHKKAKIESRMRYLESLPGDIVTMQEIVYNDNGEIFSDITFAKDTHYERLEEYVSNNPNNRLSDSEIRYATDEYHAEEKPINNMLVLIPCLMIFLFAFSAMRGMW